MANSETVDHSKTVPLIYRVFSPIMALGKFFYWIVSLCANLLIHTRQMGGLFFTTFARIPLFIKNPNLTINQMSIIGVHSLPLVLVASACIGGSAVIQTHSLFVDLVPQRYLGFVVCKLLVIELCPMLTSFVVASRVATAIAAEIGSMKVGEQLDAMTCLSLDSIRYLIVPKVIAGIIMLPVLVIFSELVAFAGSIISVIAFIKIPVSEYIHGLRLFFYAPDMIVGIIKTSIFGAVITVTGAHFGFQTKKGAKGIGEATTWAVMVSMILILFFDFLVAVLAY